MALRVADLAKKSEAIEKDVAEIVAYSNELTAKFNNEFENSRKHRKITYSLLGALFLIDIICHFVL